jgi:hypothetical protein
MLAGIEFRDGGQVRRLDVSQFAYADPKDVYELGQVDAAPDAAVRSRLLRVQRSRVRARPGRRGPDVDANLRFFRTTGGGVLALDAKR